MQSFAGALVQLKLIKFDEIFARRQSMIRIVFVRMVTTDLQHTIGRRLITIRYSTVTMKLKLEVNEKRSQTMKLCLYHLDNQPTIEYKIQQRTTNVQHTVQHLIRLLIFDTLSYMFRFVLQTALNVRKKVRLSVRENIYIKIPHKNLTLQTGSGFHRPWCTHFCIINICRVNLTYALPPSEEYNH